MSEVNAPSEEDLKWVQRKESVVRRLLPQGNSEATMVMVGELELLKKPILVFIRLRDASFMFNVTEVISRTELISRVKKKISSLLSKIFFYQIPVPTKFFLILLTPPGLEMDVVEVGRAFGAMMSNRV